MCSGGVHQFSAGSFPYTACDWQNTVFFLNIFQFSKRHRCVMCDTDWCPVPTQCSSGICCIDCWRMHPPQIRPVGVIAIVCCCFPRWTPAYSPTVGAPAHLLQRFAAVPLSIELTCPGCTPLSLFAASPLACIFPHASKFFLFFLSNAARLPPVSSALVVSHQTKPCAKQHGTALPVGKTVLRRVPVRLRRPSVQRGQPVAHLHPQRAPEQHLQLRL